LGIPIGDEELRYGEPPLVNMTFIALNTVLFIVGVLAPWLLVPGARSYYHVILELGVIPAFIVNGERLYTLITSMFLHGSLVHLLGNMLYLYIFGDNIEFVMGRFRYAIFYLVSGVIAALTHVLVTVAWSPQDIYIPAVGASGAISGVLGAYMLLFPYGRVRVIAFWGWIPMFLSLPAIVYIGFWFLYQLLMGLITAGTGVSVGVAFWAHIGGFVAGLLIAPLFVDRRRLAVARLRYYGYQEYYL
jgi:membrane associated rhomboid family serine protease